MCCHVWKSQMLSPTFPNKPFTPPWRVDAIAFFFDNFFAIRRMVHENCILHISIGLHHVLSIGRCQVKFVCPTRSIRHAPRHFVFNFSGVIPASHTKLWIVRCFWQNVVIARFVCMCECIIFSLTRGRTMSFFCGVFCHSYSSCKFRRPVMQARTFSQGFGVGKLCIDDVMVCDDYKMFLVSCICGLFCIK